MKIKTIILSSLLVIFAFSLQAQWNIPDDAKNMNPPNDPTYISVKKGKDLYYIDKGLNCLSCHGDPTKGNNKANINAPDLGSNAILTNNTVGEIFYKIKNGMGAMPSFANIHDDESIWDIAVYIKSFDENFKIKGEKVQSYTGIIDLKADAKNKTLTAEIKVTDNKGKPVSIKDVEIMFYVERYFGDLPLGDAVLTDENGKAQIKFPNDIPGDEKGKVNIYTEFKDRESYGFDIGSLELNWGQPLHFENETLNRTLWGPNDRVPLWLLFSYILVTGGVWLGIFYVIFQLTRINKAGK